LVREGKIEDELLGVLQTARNIKKKLFIFATEGEVKKKGGG